MYVQVRVVPGELGPFLDEEIVEEALARKMAEDTTDEQRKFEALGKVITDKRTSRAAFGRGWRGSMNVPVHVRISLEVCDVLGDI